jgi:long-subunit acyl-CoA synthetase (AMP-forming)
LKCHTFDAEATTITALIQKYLDQSPELPGHQFPPPSPEDIALYLHTSSASSVANVKCVPLSHESILGSAKSRLAWWKRTWPKQEFVNLRVLGWSPWSHVIGLTSDLGAAMLLTAGCYVFAMIPSAYGAAAGKSDNAARYLDVCGQLLETAIAKKPTFFAGVPWVLEGFMRTYKQETDAARKQQILEAIQRFKAFGSGGAATNAECLEWASQIKLPLVIDIGMTEIGGKFDGSSLCRGNADLRFRSVVPFDHQRC